MKSKDVISLLLELDPTGEIEVCVGNIDIFDISLEPAYYDGCYQRLIRDPENEYYNIIGGEYISEGMKICIDGMALKNAIWNNPELPIKFLDKGMDMSDYKESVKVYREHARAGDKAAKERRERRENDKL